jgi:hypothetical protein
MPHEQWSMLLHGNTQYESSIRSIIDELSTSTSFSEAINELSKLKDNPKNSFHHLFTLQDLFENLSRTGEGNNDQQDDTDWKLTTHLLRSLKEVLQSIQPEHYLL